MDFLPLRMVCGIYEVQDGELSRISEAWKLVTVSQNVMITASENIHDVVNEFLGSRAQHQVVGSEMLEVAEMLVELDNLFAQRQQP